VTSRALTAGLGVLYVAASTVAPLVLKTTPSDLDLYFWPAAETAVAGHPLLIYAAHLHGPFRDDNGPLGLLPLVPMAALANALGWAGSLTGRAALSGAVVSLFVLLLAYQAVRFIAAGRGEVRCPLAVAATIVLAPVLWIAVLDYGHTEQPVALCLVLFGVSCSLRKQNVLSGIAFGAAILTRTIAGFGVIPLLLLPFATRRGRAAATIALAALITIAVGLMPFVLADEQAVARSLLTYQEGLPIGGGSFWIVARQASWSGIVQSGDVYLAAAVAAILVVLTLGRRPAIAATHAGLIGLITVASCCLPLLAKSVFPYYFFEPYVFATLWWLARPGTAFNWRVVVPILLTVDVFIVMAATTSPSSAAGAAEGVVSSVVVAAAMALVMVDLLRSPAPSKTGRSLHEDHRPRGVPVVQDAQ
jgi:branched-subunit amino acid transport protein AzlD